MKNVAILGFGVVGSGVAKLISDNTEQISTLIGEGVNVKLILDLRDFPDSPFADRVIHDFALIENDPEIDTVIEVMGGSHPAYEYTVRALKAGKNVISSNKEVVANFGDEFLTLAKEKNLSYRFEAAVGGGIPVISPIINCVRHNKIKEVRGILNGTTNYILTKMFTYGDSFDSALKDAQAKGYAESNPDADILGIDASRKIAILASLATGKLVSVDNIATEGITGIRAADVKAADKLGRSIKLLGRCIVNEDKGPYITVAPFLLGEDCPLAKVNGVYNAIEVIGEPVGNVMFFGPGAGGGATASAVIGDLVQQYTSGENMIRPVFEKTDFNAMECLRDFATKYYVALPLGNENKVKAVFGEVTFISDIEECAFVTEELTEEEVNARLDNAKLTPLSKIRFL